MASKRAEARPKTPVRGRLPADRMAARAKVLAWYRDVARPLPWRQTRDPYETLVAETMLQQTQTGRVAPSYQQFLARFPTLDHLARAAAVDVIRAWRGLGYNRRAVDLHETAQILMREGGSVPRERAALRRLPGVGEYTAAAVACFAFDEQTPVVDTNVRRVLARVSKGVDPDEITAADAGRLAADWLPDGDAYRWNQALMDLGSLICRSERPLCPRCPLKPTCAYYRRGRHRKRRPAQTKREAFRGSRRERRGGIVDHLRDAARRGVTLAALSEALHPGRRAVDLGWLVELVEGLERDGLVVVSPAARRGSPRGTVRLPQ